MKTIFTQSKKIFTLLLFIFFYNTSALFAQIATVKIPTGDFHIDGDLEANTPSPDSGDWILGQTGSGGNVFKPNGDPIDEATTYRFTDSYKPASDNIFTQGGKFNDDPNTKWTWTTGNSSGKGDVNNVLIHLGSDPLNNDQWLIIASDRLETNGTSYIDFEFFQNELTANIDHSFSLTGGRKINDILLAVEYSNGGSVATVKFYLWSGSDYVLVNSDKAFGMTNIATANTIVNGAFGSSQYGAYQFVEAAINISAFLKLGNPCAEGGSFGNVLVKTKSSNAPAASLDDFAGPYPIKLNLGTATISGGTFCKNDANAKVIINGILGGTFSQPSGLNINTETGKIDAANSTPGSYTVTYSYTTAGCPKSTSTEVIIKSLPTASIIGTTAVCKNSTAPNITFVGATGTAPYTFTYKINDGSNLTVTTTSGNSVMVVAPTGTADTFVYKLVSVQDATCTQEQIGTATITVDPLPEASAAGGSQTICSNATATVSGASAFNGTILWTHNGSGSLTGATTLTPTYTPAVNDSGKTVTLTMTVSSNNSCGTESATATYTIKVDPLPTASAAGGNQTICSNETATVSGASASNGTILWTHNGSGSLTGATTLTPTYTPAVNDSGNTVTLTMTVTSNNTCGSAKATATYNVKVDPLPEASAAGGSQTICSNASATVSGASASNGAILWTHNGLGSLTDATTLTPTYTPVANDSGNTVTLTITVTSNNTCGSAKATATYTVTVDPLPEASAAGGSQTICSNATATVSGASASNGAILWTHNGLGSLTNATTLTPTYTPVANDSGNTVTLTMTVTSNNTCGSEKATATATYIVYVNALPSCSITGSSNTLCPSSSENIYSATPGMKTYAWSVSGNATIVGSLTSQTVSVTSGASCGVSFTLTSTITNSNGCQSECTRVINVQDTSTPTWTTETASLDKTIECSNLEALATAQALFPIATDTCDSDVTNIVKIDGEFEASEGCANAGTYTNTWTVTDDCSNTSAVFTQVITIQDTNAPTWTTETMTLNATIECSNLEALATAQALFPVATDNCDSDVTNIVKTAGEFVSSEGCANAGTYTNTWTVTDDCSNASIVFTQVITIQDTNAPTWTTETMTLNATIECSNLEALATAQALFPIATDNCDSDVTNIVKIDGEFVASEGCANAGTYTNTWTVTDDCSNTSAVFTQVITIQDTTAPTWTTETMTLNATIECSNLEALATAQALFPIATDNCDSDVTNIVKTAGEFVSSEGCANAGTYTNTWTVTDGCSNTSVVFTQVITIQDTTAPTWTTETASLDKTIECSNLEALATAQTLFPVATDACDLDVTNIVKTAGEFVASEGCANAGTYTNTWTVTDDCSNTSAVFTQVITIEDTNAPTWTTETASLDKTIECSNSEALATAQALLPVATDACDSDVTNIVKIAGEFVDSEGCANAGTYTNTWTVTDGCSNTSAVFTQVITIQDTNAPTWTTETASLDKTIECSNLDALATAQAIFPVATDTCDSDVTNIVKTAGEFVASEGCANAGTYTNTWTVTDGCSNTSVVFTQVITIEDTTAPITITDFNTSINVICDAIPLKPELVFVDNCTEVLSPIYSETISDRTPNSYLIDRKWIVSDACGNTATFDQVIRVSVTNGGATIASKSCNTDTVTIDLNSLLPAGTPTGGKWYNADETERSNIFDPLNVTGGDYVLEYKISEGDCQLSILLTMTVETDCGGIVLGCGSVLVHNAFSPNGDDKNTKFVIDNIDDTLCYPENTVEIYNRWGILVYETKNYNNTSNYFDGTSEGRTTVKQSDGLPTGTYYYILNYTSFDNNGVIQNNQQDGYLYLTR